MGSCDGFRVIAADEPVGTVVRILRHVDGQPTSLIVRAGLFRRAHRQLPVAQVEAIVPKTKRIHLMTDADVPTRIRTRSSPTVRPSEAEPLRPCRRRQERRYEDYGLTGVPETYWLDARGRIIDHYPGEISRDQLEAGIREAVTAK